MLVSKPYFEYTVRDTSIATVADLIFGDAAVFTGFKSAEEFASYNGDLEQGNITNADRIISYYTAEDQKTYEARVDFENFPIVFGTILFIPFSAVDRDIITLFGDAVVSVDSNAFIANELKNFYTNPKNIRSVVSKSKTLGTYKEMFNHISVWIWTKTLSSKVVNGEIAYEDVIINITPYITNLSTNVTKDGGSFNFSIDPILAVFNNETNKWEIDDATIKRLKNEQYVSQGHINDSDLKRKNFYFHNILQENDLVFIRFEALESETDRLQNKNVFEIDKSELQFKVFDMIGLIDVSSIQGNYGNNNEVTLNVQGRDLMKLFIEDGVYFYPFDFVQGGIFANENDSDRMTRYDGQLLGRFQTNYKKIENVMKFIINALGTIKICSDNLFSAYQNQNAPVVASSSAVNIEDEKRKFDRRTHKFKLIDSESQKIVDANSKSFNDALQEDLNAISASRKESGLVTPDKNAEDVNVKYYWGIIHSFLKSADRANALQFENLTWTSFNNDGDLIKDGEFPDYFYNNLYTRSTTIVDLINIGKEPTVSARECMKTMIRNYFKTKERNQQNDQQVSAGQFEQTPLKGIWQIVKLIIDRTVQSRLLADSSIGNEHGSLLNAIRKVCQEPFVEFYGDTYGDQYYLTVRKPPFDKQGFTSLLDGIVLNETGQLVPSEPIIVDIEDSDVLDDSLQYGAEAFSWYHITPQGNFAGGDDMAFAYLRAVYLKEYADIFGSRPLDLPTNYIPFYPFTSKDQSLGVAYFIKQGILDLQYMIQSNAYLPFVRRGTITIANGNRRIKRGCLVRLVSTGEIGFVEAVQHNSVFGMNTVDRTTTISVDRIMVERYIKGVGIPDAEGKYSLMSYFNLVNTEIPEGVFNQDKNVDDFNAQVLGKWKVNKEVFNFFLNARQFT
jgi:hypothetical protein